MLLQIEEDSSAKYPARTYKNASAADLTVAIAASFDTAGEQLTRRAAGSKYLAIDLAMPAIEAARLLFAEMRRRNARSLNVAGNGIYSLATAGWTQAALNQHVFEILSTVHAHWPIELVRSGGQTGVDIAGVVAAVALGVPAVARLPAGLLQRGMDHQDRRHSRDEIEAQVLGGAALLTDGTRQVCKPSAEGDKPAIHVRVVSARSGGLNASLTETVIPIDRSDPVLGNTFVLRDHRDRSARDSVVDLNDARLDADLRRKGPMHAALSALAERALAGEQLALQCWCKVPSGAQRRCHGDRYVEAILEIAGAQLAPTAQARPSVGGKTKQTEQPGLFESPPCSTELNTAHRHI